MKELSHFICDPMSNVRTYLYSLSKCSFHHLCPVCPSAMSIYPVCLSILSICLYVSVLSIYLSCLSIFSICLYLSVISVLSLCFGELPSTLWLDGHWQQSSQEHICTEHNIAAARVIQQMSCQRHGHLLPVQRSVRFSEVFGQLGRENVERSELEEADRQGVGIATLGEANGTSGYISQEIPETA